MQRLLKKSVFFICPRFRWSAGAVAGLLCIAVVAPAQAQKKDTPPASSCLPSDLAGGIVVQGRTVYVSPVPERLVAPGGEQPATPNTGPTAPKSADMHEAYKVFAREAKNGNAAAMVNLALATLAGWGTEPNADAALYWLHTAADKGYPRAAYDLGILYMRGCGVRQDFAEAFRYFEQGARGGDAAAQMNLGYLYDRGLGVIQDRAMAARWYCQAAESGEPQAQYNLGEMYLQGEGVAQDDAAAFAWFKKAAVPGHREARIMVGSMYAAGRGTAKDLVAAYAWLSAAAQQADARANDTLLAVTKQLSPAQLAEAKLRAQSLANNASHQVASLH